MVFQMLKLLLRSSFSFPPSKGSQYKTSNMLFLLELIRKIAVSVGKFTQGVVDCFLLLAPVWVFVRYKELGIPDLDSLTEGQLAEYLAGIAEGEPDCPDEDEDEISNDSSDSVDNTGEKIKVNPRG